MLKPTRLFSFLIVFLIFWGNPVSAQNDWQIIDESLNQKLNSDPNIALEQAQQILDTNQYTFETNHEAWFSLNEIIAHAQVNLGYFDSALVIATQLYEQHNAQTYPIYRVRALLLLAMLSERRSEVKNVQAKSLEGLKLLKNVKTPHPILKADLYALLGTSYRSQADYGNALKYAKLAAELSKSNLPKLARAHNQIGVIYDYSGNFELSLKHHELSLNIRRQNNNQQGISDSLYNIGEIYRDMQQFKQALQHFKQALKVDQSLGNPYHIANSHGKLGQVYLAMGKIQLAKEHIKQGIEITKSMKAPGDTGWQLSNMAQVYIAQGRFDEAQTIAMEALELALQADAKRTEQTIRMTLLDISIKQGNLKLAREHIELLLSMPNTGLQYQQKLYQVSAKLYEEEGNAVDAYQSLKQFVDVQKKRNVDLQKQQTARLRQNVEVIRQEQELNLLLKEKDLQQAQLNNLKLQRGIVMLIMLLLAGAVLMIYCKQVTKQKMTDLTASMLATNLEEKNQLLADVSHELRTPLAALKLSVELLEHNIEPDVNKAYARVHGKISQLDNLIGDIYRSAQFDNNVMQLNKERCNLGALIQDIVSDFEPQFQEKPQSLTVSKLPSNLMCTVDPERFKQIIINLLNNSLAYTYENGETHISIDVIDHGSTKKVQLIVADSEPGLNDIELSKIFERLYRVESSRNRDLGGSGLGLAICRQIVLAHGGEIVAEQSALGGVAFKVQLTINNV
ncbi:Adaptive-response sensory-kinase SasA [Pseudoalteromonas sp. CIP111854]|uniref:histidine kinase n=1 Tax=Pseudoalteromonas holothuriae TaxID=2963714 RepID=A0A9W4R3X6_9GAMM|nr:tetratricopeptide repeat protein [Pseudoalteromonas sp. CIP111854]CAH9065704.1 Adaptive-response sensory-kinase SasA [Pseudoalteromonas sp. CIP111854]